MISSLLVGAAVATAPIKDDWSVKKLEFSAVSIGVAMTDHKTGYSSFTNGASSIKITKTTDGGATWTPVKNQTTALMVMGVAASTSPKLDVVTTGMGATKYSTDGDTFKSSLFGPFVSQSIQASSGGRVVLATEAGILMSKNGGETYSHKKVTGLKTAGRYAAAPSDQVIYMTAGQWPEHSNASSREVQLSSNLRVTNRSWGGQFGSRIGVETGARAHPIVEAGAPPPPPPTGYAAQIVKSTDGGNTWTTLMTDMDNFYFNEINCFDGACLPRPPPRKEAMRPSTRFASADHPLVALAPAPQRPTVWLSVRALGTTAPRPRAVTCTSRRTAPTSPSPTTRLLTEPPSWQRRCNGRPQPHVLPKAHSPRPKAQPRDWTRHTPNG